jgi:LuxR family maltose regulon positive regulatory protein
LLAALQGETKDERRKMDADSSPVTRPSSSLVEPLSEREIEVLRLLTTSLSSTEIAQELVISVNTVRSHVKSIYAKLDVHSRYKALARAKELNLL